MMASELANGNHDVKCKVCNAFVQEGHVEGGAHRYYCERCGTWRMEWIR